MSRGSRWGQERYARGISAPVDWHMQMRDNRTFTDASDQRSEKNMCVLCGTRHGQTSACPVKFWDNYDEHAAERNGAYTGTCAVRTLPFGLCLTPAIENMGRLGQKNWRRAQRDGRV